MAPAKKAAPKAAAAGKSASTTSTATRAAKAKPTSTTKVDKAANASSSSPASKRKSVRVAADDAPKDSPTTAVKKQAKAKADKVLDAAGEPKKRLPSKGAAKKQAEESQEELKEDDTSKKTANGKKRARDAADDDVNAEEAAPVASPAASKAATGKAKKQQQQQQTKKKSAKTVAAAVEEGVAEAAAGEQEEEEEEEDGALDEAEIIDGLSDVSGSDDDADSSDEEDEGDVEAGKQASILTVKLPNAKDDHSVKQRLDKVAKRKEANKTTEVPATLYFGRLPRGFLEEQLRSYLSQFGDVRRLRVSRNRKTGKPKHYAFVEFADKDVAAIVQETMNNYLIDGHLLQVREVPKDKIHPKLWIGANRKYRAIPVDRVERVRRSQPKTEERHKKHNDRLLRRQDARRHNIKAAGIDYEFEGHKIEA